MMEVTTVILVITLSICSAKNYLPELEKDTEYKVSVRTGDVTRGGTKSDISLTIHGENGVIQSKLEKSNNVFSFVRGNTDWFNLKGQNIGRIEKIEIDLKANWLMKEWFLEEIMIHNVTSKNHTYLFVCHCWITPDNHYKMIEPIKKPAENPGFKTRITDKAIHYTIAEGIDWAINNLDKIPVPDRDHDKIIAGLSLTNMRVEFLSKPLIKVVKSAKTIYAKIFIDKVSLWTDYLAYYLMIKGTGDLHITATSLNLVLSMSIGRNDDDLPYINLLNCDGKGEWSMNFQGKHQTILNLLTIPFPGLVNDECMSDICSVLSQTVYEQINPLIKQKLQPRIAFQEICLDISSQEKPNTLVGAIELSHRGVFTSSCETDISSVEKNPSQIPFINQNDNGKMVYAYVTDFSINSLMDAAYQGNMLHYKITNDVIPKEFQMYTSMIKMMIPDLRGTETDLELHVKAIESPKIFFKDDKTFIESSFETKLFFVGENQSYHITTLNQTASLEFDFEYSNSTLHFNIEDIDSQMDIVFISYEPFGKTLKLVINPVIYLMKSLANKAGKKGIEVEIPDFNDIVQLQDEIKIPNFNDIVQLQNTSLTMDKEGRNYIIFSTDFSLQIDNLIPIIETLSSY